MATIYRGLAFEWDRDRQVEVFTAWQVEDAGPKAAWCKGDLIDTIEVEPDIQAVRAAVIEYGDEFSRL